MKKEILIVWASELEFIITVLKMDEDFSKNLYGGLPANQDAPQNQPFDEVDFQRNPDPKRYPIHPWKNFFPEKINILSQKNEPKQFF